MCLQEFPAVFHVWQPAKSSFTQLRLRPHPPALAERDPDFGANAAAQLDKRKKVVVYCGRGGTIKTGFGNEKNGKFFKDDPERAFGIETRSLKGCYELFEVRFRGRGCFR